MITTLYRPVGIKELEKIAISGLNSFPPRLPEQPIFYPVLNIEYAIQIASDWNTKDINSGYCGFVTKFGVDADYLKKFDVKQVGSNKHKEYWIPSDELFEFNAKIVDGIQIVAAFYGELYVGDHFDFKNKTVDEQIDFLENMF